MLSNFIFNSWFNNFPSPPASRSVSLFSNAASSNFVFSCFPSFFPPPATSKKETEKPWNVNAKTAEKNFTTFCMSLQGKSEIFLHSRLQIMKWIPLFLFPCSPARFSLLWCELKRVYKHWIVSFAARRVMFVRVGIHEKFTAKRKCRWRFIIPLHIKLGLFPFLLISQEMAKQRVEFP